MTQRASSRPILRRLALSTVLAGGAVAAMPAAAQVNTPQTPVVQVGTGVVFTGNAQGAPVTLNAGDAAATAVNGASTSLSVDLAGNAATVIDWGSFNVSTGSRVDFSTATAAGNVAVLNRVTTIDPGAVSAIDGAIGAGGRVAVWLANPNGVIVGANGAINTGAFVATTLTIDPADFAANALGGEVALRPAAANGAISLNGTPAQRATLATGGPLVLVAPTINSNAAASGSDVAFVVASDATVSARPGSPVGITIRAGTPVAGANVIAGTVNGERVYVAGARPVDAMQSLLRIDGAITAASTTSGSIVIAAGPQAASGLTIADNAATGGDVALGVSGSLAIAPGADAASLVRVAGGDAVSVGGDIRSTGAVALAGDTLVLGQAGATRSIVADTGLSATATGGDLTGTGALVLRASAAGTGTGAVRLETRGAGAAMRLGGTAVDAGSGDVQLVSLDTGGVLALGDVTAGSLLSGLGAGPLLGRVTRGADVALGDVTLSAGALDIETLAGAAVATGDVRAAGVRLSAAGRLTAGTIDGAAVTLGWGAAGVGTGAISTRAGALDAAGIGSAVIDGASVVGGDASIIAGDAAAGVQVTGGLSAEGAVTLAAGTGGITTAGLSGGLTTITSTGATRLGGTTNIGNGSTIVGDAGLAFGAVTGSGNLSLTSSAGSVAGTSVATVGGVITANGETGLSIDIVSAAAGGGVSLSTDLPGSGDLRIGSLTADSAGVSAVARGSLSVETLVVTGGGEAALTAFGAGARLGGASVDGRLEVGTGTGGTATVAGDVTAGGDFTVNADAVVLGGAPGVTMQAGGRISLISGTGTIAGQPGLTLTSDTDASSPDDGIGIDAGGAILFAGTTLNARPGGNAAFGLRTRGDGSVVLGTVNAGRFGGLAGAPGEFTPTYFGAGDFAANAITAGAVGIDLTTGTIAIDRLAATGAVALDSDGAIRLGNTRAGSLTARAGDGLALGDLETAGDVSVTGASVVLDRLASTTGSVSAQATDGLLGIGTVSAATRADLATTGAGDISLGSVTAGTVVDIAARMGGVGVDGVAAVGRIDVAASGSVTGRASGNGASLASGAGSVTVSAGDAALLADLSAAGAIDVLAARLGVGSAMAGATLRLDAASGDAVLGSGASNAASVTAAGGVRIDTLVSTGPVSLAAGTTLDARILDAAGEITVDAGGRAGIDTLRGVGPVRITAGSIGVRDLVADDLRLTSTAGAIELTTASAGTATLAAATDLTILDRLTGRGVSTLTAGERVTVGALAGGSEAVVTGGSVTLGSVDVIGALTVQARAGDLRLDRGMVAARFDGDGGAVLDATGDITVGTLRAAGDVSVGAAGMVSAGVIDAGDFALVRSQGVGTIDTLTGAAVSAAGSALAVRVADARQDLVLTSTAGPLSLGSGTAGGTAALTSAGALTVGTGLQATGDVALAAPGLAVVAQVESIGGAVTLTAGSARVIEAQAGRDLALTATAGDLTLSLGAALGAATLTAAGGIVASEVTSGGAATIGGASVRLGRVATGDGAIRVTAPGAVTGIADLGRADLLAGGAGIVTVEAGTTARLGSVIGQAVAVVAQDLFATAVTARTGDARLTADGGNLFEGVVEAASGAATVQATGFLGADRIAAGSDVTVTAGGGAAIGVIAGRVVRSSTGDLTLGSVSASADLALATMGGPLTLGNGSSAGAASLTSAADLAITGALAAGGAATIVTSGSARIAGVRTGNGAIAVTASRDIVAAAGGGGDLMAGGGGAVEVDAGGAVQLGSLAGGTLTVAAAGDALSLANGVASGGATLTSGGAMLVAGALTAGGAVSTSSAGATTIGTVASTGAGVTLRGRSVDAGMADAAGALAIASTGGVAAVGSGTAGTTATIAAAAGDAVVGTRLRSGGTATITASGDARLADVATGNGALGIVAGGAVTGATENGRADLEARGAGAALTVAAGGMARLGTAVAAGNATVRAGSVDATRIAATAGALAATATGGGLTLGSGSAATGATLNAAGLASLGAVSGGPAITLTAADAAITGAQTAAAITVVNRDPGGQPLRLGDRLAGGGFQLADAEIRQFQTPSLTLQGGTGAVELGDLAFTAQAGAGSVAVLTTGAVRVTGTVSGAGAARSVRIGGSDVATARASEIRIVTQPSGGGRLLMGDAALELRGTRIAQGQANLTDRLLNGGGLSAEQASAQFTSNPNSPLYAPVLGGRPYEAGAATTISAGRLTVAYDVFALFQNTGPTGFNSGAVIGSAIQPLSGAVTLAGAGAAVPNSFALFGAINGVGGQAASVLGAAVIVTNNSVDVPNSRINGCVIGSGAGCITTTVAQPVLNVFDQSRINVLSTAEDFAVPFDPVIGGNNEALFAGVSAVDVPPGQAECDNGSTDPQCGGAGNQETRP